MKLSENKRRKNERVNKKDNYELTYTDTMAPLTLLRFLTNPKSDA